MSLKNNKRMLCYKGGTSVKTSKSVPSAWNILMLRERRHVKDKDTWGKFLHGSRCEVAEERSVARLAYKECFEGSVERNMEQELSPKTQI